MLVLSRKPAESIQIGSDIRVIVVSVSNGRVKLGFEAPDDVRILRSEVKDRDAFAVAGEQLASLVPAGASATSTMSAAPR